MRKILAGFIVAVAIGVPAVYFGLPLWAQRQALRDVDAAFDGLQTSVGKASHGAVSYDVWTRTLKIADVAVESSDPSPIVLKAAQLVATGVSSSAGDRFSAARIEISNGELAGLQIGPSETRTTYRAPKITLDGFSGPVRVTRRPAVVESAGATLAILDALAAMTATTVTVATLSATDEIPPPRGIYPTAPVEYGMTGLTLRDLGDGRIGEAKVEHVATTGAVPGFGTYVGEVQNLEAAGVDFGALIALIDPAQSKDDHYRQVYRRVAVGPYSVTFNQGATLGFEGLRLDDFAVRPSKFPEAGILALGEKLRSGNSLLFNDPAAARALNAQLATAYEGARVGNFEMRGITGSMSPNITAKVGTLRISGMENGKIAEFAFEGVDARFPANEPIVIGRLALQGIDMVNLMRAAAQTTPGQTLGSEQALRLLPMLGGFDLKNVTYAKNPNQPLHIDTLALSWGDFVGAIPSRIRAASKFELGIDPASTDTTLKYFADAGIKQIAVDFDLGAAWNETTRTIAVTPLTAEVTDIYAASAKLTINNVPRALFSPDPMTVTQTATLLDAGPLEFTLRDVGGSNLIFARVAKEQGMTPEAARKTMTEAVRAFALMNPDAQVLAAAVAKLIEMPGSTLTVKATPKGRVNLAQALDAARGNPPALLSQFNVEADAVR